MTTLLKQALKSRTVLFGLSLSLASIVQLFIPFFPTQYIGIAGAVVGAVVIALRFLTTIPVNER